MSKTQSEPSYGNLLNDATKLLKASSDSPRTDSEVLLQHAIDKSRAWLMAYADNVACAAHIRDFSALIEQRRQGQPVAYLLGYRDFWTLRLKVDQQVLIPRPDTETLVEQALKVLDQKAQLSVLELGTGSGAIALSIAKERPRAHVLAVDSQPSALAVAKENAQLNQLTNVSFLLSDWFAKVSATAFDLIASNPPYVRATDPHLQRGDLRFEPNSALIGGGDGFDDVQRIIASAPDYLVNGGWLLLEHGADQHPAVRAHMAKAGFVNIGLRRDLNDLPRCCAGQWLN